MGEVLKENINLIFLHTVYKFCCFYPHSAHFERFFKQLIWVIESISVRSTKLCEI